MGQEARKLLDKPTPSPPPWTWGAPQWSAAGEQTFKIDYDEDTDLDFADAADEGEYSVGAKFTLSGPRYFDIAFSPLAVANPYLFDNQEETGSWSFGTRLQRKIDLTEVAHNGARRELQDNLLPFLSYKFGQEFEGDASNDTQEAIAGVAFTDVRGYLCEYTEAPRLGPGCSGGGGTQYTLTLSYSATYSGDPDDERQGPRIQFEWTKPVTTYYGLWLDASIERRTYDSFKSDAGTEDADAGRYAIAAGIDFSGWAQRFGASPDLTLKLGVRWVGVDANRESLDRDEFAIIPSLSWSHKSERTPRHP